MTDAIPSRAAIVYRGFFHLRWLADDESVRSAGDGTGAIVIESPRGSRRVEMGQPWITLDVLRTPHDRQP